MTATEETSPPPARRGWLAFALLFGVALVVRAVFLVQLTGSPFADERGLIEDALYYHQRGAEIAAGDWIGDTPAYLSPLYCDLIGAQYALAGESVLGIKWTQVLLGSLSCLLLARIGARLFGRRTGLVAGALLAGYGLHIYYAGVLLPTTLVLLLNLACLWVLVEGRGTAALWRWGVAGLFVGLAMAAKSNAILLLPAFGLWALWLGEGAWRGRFLRVALLVAGCALAIAPYTWRNQRVSGEPVLVSANGGLNLLKGNGPSATGSHAFLTPGVTDINLADFIAHRVTPAEALASDRRMKEEAKRYVLEHPVETLVLLRRKLGLALHPFELGIRDQYRFVREHLAWLRGPWVAFGWVAPLGLVGLCFAWRRRPGCPGGPGCGSRRNVGLLYALFAVQLATLLIVFVLARYRLVAAACLLLFAADELARWGELARARQTRGLVTAAAVTALAYLYAWTPVSGFTFVDPFADQYRFVGDALEAQGDHRGAIDAFRAGCDYPWASGLVDTRAMERFIRRNERKLERAEAREG